MGWCLAGSRTAETKPPEDVIASTTSSFPVTEEDGQVHVNKAGLAKTLGQSATSGLNCERYAGPQVDSTAGHTPFTTALGLDSQQVETFHRIFKEAAETRLAWEMSNARVKPIAPGEWEIQIPGDGGSANRQMREDLTQAFGSELAQRIELSADLDGFFNLGELDPGFRHGTLRLRTRRETADGPLRSLLPKDHIRLAIQSEEKTVTFHLGDGSTGSDQLGWRLGRLVGGDEAIRAAAPLHVLDGRH